MGKALCRLHGEETITGTQEVFWLCDRRQPWRNTDRTHFAKHGYDVAMHYLVIYCVLTAIVTGNNVLFVSQHPLYAILYSLCCLILKLNKIIK